MNQSTITAGVSPAAHRILAGRALELAGSDEERAARIVAAQLPWLAHLDDQERQVCLDDVLDALVDHRDLDEVLQTWSDVAERRHRLPSRR